MFWANYASKSVKKKEKCLIRRGWGLKSAKKSVTYYLNVPCISQIDWKYFVHFLDFASLYGTSLYFNTGAAKLFGGPQFCHVCNKDIFLREAHWSSGERQGLTLRGSGWKTRIVKPDKSWKHFPGNPRTLSENNSN